MKTLNKIVLFLIVALSVMVSIPYDYCEEKMYYFKHKLTWEDDAILSILTVISIAAVALTIFGICYHFDVAGMLRDYYWELCRKLTWT